MASTELDTPKFSLLEIESALSELLTARAEAEEIVDPAEKEQALIAVDEAMCEYVAREIQKADSIIGFCRTLRHAFDAAKEDRDYYARRAQFLDRTLSRVKELTQTAMEATGRKRIDGRRGYLLLKGNGGLQPLNIPDPFKIPDEFCDYRAVIPGDLWNEIENAGFDLPPALREPSQQRIRQAISAGEGVPGAHLLERGSHVEVK